MRSLSLTVAVIAAILIVLGAASTTEAADWKKGKLGHLSRLIGTGDADALLNDPEVKRHLAQVVGKDDIGLLKENLTEHGPINFIDGNLVLSGYAPEKDGQKDDSERAKEMGTLWVRVYDGSVRATIVHEGNVSIYGKDSKYYYIPGPLRDYARYRLSPFTADEDPPQGVRWQK
jgi:hypothetical protein